MSENITWNFTYKNQKFENRFIKHIHGDFMFSQNDLGLPVRDEEERVFLALLIYAMQKLTSPGETKQQLGYLTKNILKGKENLGEEQIFNPYSSVFWGFEFFSTFNFEHYGRKIISKIEDNSLTISSDKPENKKIIFPSKQIFPSIEKLIQASGEHFFRTPLDSLACFIDYYSSGKLEEKLNDLNPPII